MLTLEAAPVSKNKSPIADPYCVAVEAAMSAYRASARGLSPERAPRTPLGKSFEAQDAEVETLLTLAQARAAGKRLRGVLIRPIWEPLPTEIGIRGRVRAVIRLLAEENNSAREEKDLVLALYRLLYAGRDQAYREALHCFEQEPRLRSAPALVEMLRSSDGYSVASAYLSLRCVLLTALFVAVYFWASPEMTRNVIATTIASSVVSIVTLLSVWLRPKRRSKSCAPLLRMLEEVEITDPKTQRWALDPIRMLAMRSSGQPRAIREQAQRLTHRRWEHSAEFLPISAVSPTPTAESLPVPSKSVEPSAGSE